MLNDLIKELTLQSLMTSPAGEKLRQAMDCICGAQEKLYALAANVREDGVVLVKLRVGTVLAMTFFGRLAAGKKPGDLTGQDWEEIAQAVSKYAICVDGQRYSEFVFRLYADYIDASASGISALVSPETEESIRALAEELRAKIELLRDGKIKETDYVEECLWIALEAMIKLISSLTEQIFGPKNKEYARLAEASAQLAFEYARYQLYSQEQAILTEYIEHQYEVDAELEEKYRLYVEAMKTDAERFEKLIRAAFQTDFRTSLKASGELARSVGVKEEDILDTMDKIDAFFL